MADENGAAAVGTPGPRAVAEDPLHCALPPLGELVEGAMLTMRVRHEWRGFPLVVPGALQAQVWLVTYCVHCRLTQFAPLPLPQAPGGGTLRR